LTGSNRRSSSVGRRHLVRSGSDADEVIDFVYTELLHAHGRRRAAVKFRTYTGRGTLRGWLRTVMLHATVDLYRGRKDEISLEEWTGSGDETRERQTLLTPVSGTEDSMLVTVVRERYRPPRWLRWINLWRRCTNTRRVVALLSRRGFEASRDCSHCRTATISDQALVSAAI